MPDGRKADQLLKLTQRAGRLWVWRIDAATMKLYSVGRLVGQDGSETVPMDLGAALDSFEPGHRHALERLIATLVEKGEPFSFEAESRRNDGAHDFYAIEAEPQFDADGNVIGIFGVTRNVTEMRSASADAAQSLTMLERAQRVGRMGHWRMPAGGRELVWSTVMHDLLGVPAGETATVEDFYAMLVPEHRDRIIAERERAVAARRAFDYTCDLVTRDGRRISIETVAEPEFDDDGGFTGFFGITRDITDLHGVQRRLSRQTRLLERAQLMGRMGHWSLEADDGQLVCSRALCEIYGVDPEGPITAGMLLDMIVPEDRDAVVAMRDAALRRRRKFSFVADVERPDGQRITIESAGEPDFDENGVYVGYFGITQDITEDRQAELKLKQHARMLERAHRVGQMGHWRISRGSQLVDASETLLEMFGMDAADTITIDDIHDMMDPASRARAEQGRAAADRDLSDFSYVADLLTPAGKALGIETVAQPEFDERGHFAGYFGITRDITRLRNVERQLREQNMALERAQTMGRIGHWRIDMATDALFWSDTVYDILGVPRDRKIWTTYILDLIVSDQSEEICEIRESAIARKKGYSYQADIRTADGSPKIIHVVGEPQFDDNGRLAGYFGTTQDVTERIVAERDLREADERLQNIFDALDRAGVGIGVRDDRGHIVSARPAFLSISGVSSEEDLLGRRWPSVQGEGGTDFSAELDRAIPGERPERSRNLYVDWVRPDGDQVSVLVRLETLPGGESAMIVLDQTEQRKARQEIEARELRTRAILQAIDAAGIGYCVLDDEGRIFSASPTLRDSLRISRDEDLLGRSWLVGLNLPEEIREKIAAENQAYVDGFPGSYVYPDFVMELPDGSRAQLHARSTPLPGIGRLVLVMDRTEWWLLEKRQAEIERHLQEAQKMEAIGQLAGGVAHEINNMLHPIRTFTRAAARTDDPEKRNQLLDRVMDCADKAAHIVRETLSFARGEDGAAEPRSLNSLLTNALAFSRDLKMRDIELEFQLPEDDLVVRVNETEFTQVMLNLLRNAADAMDGQGIISILLDEVRLGDNESPSLPAGPYARFRVVDDGPGIPPEVADRIFEPFFTTKETGKGTGLGLSVVYGIVKRWGGMIDIHSQPGEGATVEVLLPLVEGSVTLGGTG